MRIVFHGREARFEFDHDEQVLLKDGQPLRTPLGPHKMKLLLQFVEHPLEVLTREQLARVVWGRRHVASTSVDKLVSAIRDALGDDKLEQRIIQTVRPAKGDPRPKRGYQFVGEFERPALEREPEDSPEALVGSAPRAPTAAGSLFDDRRNGRSREPKSDFLGLFQILKNCYVAVGASNPTQQMESA